MKEVDFFHKVSEVRTYYSPKTTRKGGSHLQVRILHRLPGRLRLDIPGMRNHPLVSQTLQAAFKGIQGVQEIQCNAHTGHALIRYHVSDITENQLINRVSLLVSNGSPVSDTPSQIAATSEKEVMAIPPTFSEYPALQEKGVHQKGVHRMFQISGQPNAGSPNPYRATATASLCLLCGLSLKRLFIGRSLLASAPLPFYAAAGFAIAAGYPMVRRTIEEWSGKRRIHPELLFNVAAISLAALRENLVALSAITLINVAMYRRTNVLPSMNSKMTLDPEINRHSHKMSRFGVWTASLSLLVTRSPLRSLGVLLAANPRPAQLAHQHAWAAAEQEMFARKLLVPKEGSLSTLATVRTIVFADGTHLHEDSREWTLRVVQTGLEEEKVMTLAASLLKKAEGHPLCSPLLEAVEKEQRTLRTPFHVEQTEEGIRGVLGGSEVLLGTKAFVSTYDIDLTPVLLEERRMRRNGFKVHILVQDGQILALLGCKQQVSSRWRDRIEQWENQGYSIRCLQREERLPSPFQMITEYEMKQELEEGHPVLLIGEPDGSINHHPNLVTLSLADASQLDEVFALCTEVKEQVKRDLRVVKTWNVMGTGLAFMAPISAPVINLLADSVGLFLLSRQKWKQRFRKNGQKQVSIRRTVEKKRLDYSDNGSIYHAMEEADVFKAVGGHPTGLTDAEVSFKRKTYGFNRLQAPPPPNPVHVFLSQFKDFSTLTLLGATGLSFLMGESLHAICMGSILVVNAFIGAWQELRSAQVLLALKNEENRNVKTIRNGTEQLVSMEELVPGDLVYLEAGDFVPADLRILECSNLEVNEAMLTGESVPVAKQSMPLASQTPLAERTNLLYMGTLVTRGRVKALVVSTGQNTQIGALQDLLHQGEEPPTPLQMRVSQLGKHFVTGAMIAGGIVLAAGLLRGMPPAQLLLSAVTLAASAIPEGLPLTITIALTAGVMRMAKKKTVVRKLASLESLGRVTVICSDKTGTLTRNEMTVKELATVGRRVRVTGDGYTPEGQFYLSDDNAFIPRYQLDEDIRQLLTIGLLCNNASIEKREEKYIPIGDPTEAAILVAAQKAGLRQETWKRHREIPFDSKTGSMSVVCKGIESNENCLVLTKGSPEVILRKCTHYLENGEILALTEEVRQEVLAENKRMAEQAFRVLGFAYRPVQEGEKLADVSDEALIFVGLMGMLDPVKEDVAACIEEARRLGVKTVMITGDHPVTACAIGKQLGIYQQGDRILSGEELERLSPHELDTLVQTTSIFARVSPEQKLRIVEAYQRCGEVVAMTGDGVNDAPAIRKADVGIAMGSQGTGITKDTAGIVLMEDDFRSIVTGIKEGRTIIGNIRKAIGCLVTGNLAEVFVATTAIVIGLPMPLIPLQILLMNLLTDALPAMVLATDSQTTGEGERHQDVIDRSLYRTILTRGTILGLGALGVFVGSLASGLSLPIAQTMTFATLVAGQLIQTVSWRYLETKPHSARKNDRSLFLTMGASWLALLTAIYIPGLQRIFGTVALGLPQWGIILAVSGSVTKLSAQVLKGFDSGTKLVQTGQPALAA
jgi:Ca2+-transporting ATPase